MKLRIRGNSIRLRLTRREVEEFGRTRKIEENVDFGPGNSTFTYALRADQCTSLSAKFEDGQICVCVPESNARDWIGSDSVGIESDGGRLRILIEKDFSCLKEGPGENEDDAFPNPRAAGAA